MDYNQFKRAEQNMQYFMAMRPVFNKKALFSDMTGDYVIPPDPAPYSRVKIRFRTAKNNVDFVFLNHNAHKHMMNRVERDTTFDYYEIEVPLEDIKFEYYFEIMIGKIVCYYDLRGVVKETSEYYYFTLVPGLSYPKWAMGAVMYQIYVDRFCNGDPSNDVLDHEYNYIGEHVNRVTDWYKYPAMMGVREFYGGDLQGVLDKMDYLQDLGVDVIYFNPLFVSPSNHKYDIQDYDYIDPHIGRIVSDEGELLPEGEHENRKASRYINRVANKANLEASNQLFAQLVEEAHRRGIRVILDGVFNHCGSFNKWMDRERVYEDFEGYPKGAFISADSPYKDYFEFYQKDKWPYNPSYDGWWGHDTLPKLNYEGSQDLYNYVLEIGKKWVSPPYNCDGWRLDVAADLGHSPEMNHKFWKDFRNAVREANPDAIVLAEHYGSPKDWIENGEWDTVMNYDAFMEPVTWFLTGMQKHSDDYREDLLGNAESFWGAMVHHGAAFTGGSSLIAMNELSNHDHSRFLTRTNKKVGRVNTLGSEAAGWDINKAVMREAVMIQMTWPGAPTIYYGDEAGVCGFTDPDNRRTYPWGREDHEMIDFHKAMVRIHKENAELMTGSMKKELADYNVISYSRFNRKEGSLIVINNNNREVSLEVSVWDMGVAREAMMKRLMLTDCDGFTDEPAEVEVHAGKVKLTMKATSGILLKYKSDDYSFGIREI
ncbi:MAG: glycoside hydrolase family 13 protein [Lachnospiraceae bacterium]|nr:glycoside hydrolase family 13 protein [Lachnospiraceae bacterium]